MRDLKMSKLKYSVNAKEMDRLMLDYKETKKDETFNVITKKMRGIIVTKALQTSKRCNSNLYDKEDFEVMIEQYIWKAIQNYKFRCPICGLVAKNEQAYRRHIKDRHRCGSISENSKKIKMVIPYSSIFLYAVSDFEMRLVSLIRDENNEKRKANTHDYRISEVTTSEDGEEQDTLSNIKSNFSLENSFITTNTIEVMMEKLQKENKKVHEYVLKGLLEGSSNKDLATTLHNAKMYKTLESAKSTVSKICNEIKSMYLQIAG